MRCKGGLAIAEPRVANETFKRKSSAAAGGYRTTHIIDITDLVDPKAPTSARTSRLSTTACAFPDGFACQSSCGAGVGCRDVRSVKGEPTGKGVNAAGFSDNLARGRP